MDKVSNITDTFGFGLSMHSQRTSNHGPINNESKRLWNIYDGMTYTTAIKINIIILTGVLSIHVLCQEQLLNLS